MKDTVVGHTDESGVTIPPLHPRCRCAIMYREVGIPRVMQPKPTINPAIVAPLIVPSTEPTKPNPNPKPSEPVDLPTTPDSDFDFDVQRFGGQKLPDGEYNLKIKRSAQARHIEGTKEYTDYVEKAAGTGFVPSKLAPGIIAQALVNNFHGKGIYDPNPRDGSARERVDTGQVIGQYWDKASGKFVDTTWIEIVYSKKGTHIYPNRPLKEV